MDLLDDGIERYLLGRHVCQVIGNTIVQLCRICVSDLIAVTGID